MKAAALLLLLGAAGCAHLDGELTPPGAGVVAKYGAVRAGAVGRASVDGYRFTRTSQGIVASPVFPRVADEEAYVIADESIGGAVSDQLRFDPALAPGGLAYRVADRVVYLRGTADDAVATRAIFDVLRLPGVDVVCANLERPVVAR